jgi:hypothetical protein
MKRKTSILRAYINRLCDELDLQTELFLSERPFLIPGEKLVAGDIALMLEQTRNKIQIMTREIDKLL